jgi:hypothetical protein
MRTSSAKDLLGGRGPSGAIGNIPLPGSEDE